MARDYRKSRAKPSHSGPSRLVCFLFGILIGLMISGVFYIKNNKNNNINKNIINKHTVKITKPIITTPAPTKPAPPKTLETQFDFYHALSNPGTSKPIIQSPSKTFSYITQIAVLSKPEEIDSLKAQLLLLGFDVHITPVTQDNKTLQRIWLGPFTNKANAVLIQQQLKQNQIPSTVLKSS